MDNIESNNINLPTKKILIGSKFDEALAIKINGDVTINEYGTTKINNKKINNSMLAGNIEPLVAALQKS